MAKSNVPTWGLRPNMKPNNGLGNRILKDSRPYDGLRPTHGFFPRLKNQFYAASQFCTLLLQCFCQAKEHGCVYIMPASMTDALIQRWP